MFCKGRHNSIVCFKKAADSTVNNLSVAGKKGLVNMTAENSVLQTGFIWVSSRLSRVVCRVLLDPGSQKSYITDSLAIRLGLQETGAESLITHTLGGNVSRPNRYSVYNVGIASCFSKFVAIPIKCLGVPIITSRKLPLTPPIKEVQPIADHFVNFSSLEIDLLLGADSLPSIMLGEERILKDLIAVNTKLGWFIYGRGQENRTNHTLSALCAFQSVDINPLCKGEDKNYETEESYANEIDFLSNTEVLGIERPGEEVNQTANELYESIFKACIKRLPSMRYSPLIPFNEKLPSLGDNEKLAPIRLKHFLDKSYKKIIEAADLELDKYLQEGFIEKARPRMVGEFAHYLPLQAVVRPNPESSQGIKIRLVKDAGARSRDLASLNDVLHQRPNLLPNLLQILINFRLQPIVVLSDIEKAFHQFEIAEEHRTFLRFLWRPGYSKNPNAPIQVFCAKCLDFGLISSPWLHQAEIKVHIEQELSKFPNEMNFLKTLQRSIYMDDISVQ